MAVAAASAPETPLPPPKRARLLVLLGTVLGLPSVAGFGLTTGAGFAGVRTATDGALVTRGSSAVLARSSRERCRGQRAQGGRRGVGVRGARVITCRVAGPRKYGSAVSVTER